MKSLNLIFFFFFSTVTNPSVEALDCHAQGDILFLLDASASLGYSNFRTVLQFVAKLTGSFNLGRNAVQFGSIIFGNSADINFDFDSYTSHAGLERAILSAPYYSENTYTDMALKKAREEMFTSAHGSRPGVPKLVIVFTDGQSSQPDATIREAYLLKNTGVHVMSIGIGTGVVDSELRTIASSPSDVYRVNDFHVLDSIQKQLANQTCQLVTNAAPPCDTQADIMFLLDSSRSLNNSTYFKMIDFVKRMTRGFTLGPNAAQFGVIVFGNDAQFVFDLDTYWNHATLEQGIMNVPYLAQNTYTHAALKLAREQAYTAAHGGRPNVRRIAIVFTDGQSAIPPVTAQEAKELKEAGVMVLAVGLGNAYDPVELANIASLPRDVYNATDFKTLDSMLGDLAVRTCTIDIPPELSCPHEADIMFIMDSSASITYNDHNTLLRFVSNLTNNFQLGPQEVQFGALMFGDDAQMVFDFDRYTSHTQLQQAILASPYLAESSNGNRALELAREAFTTGHGSRPNIPKIAIVLTDGQWTNSQSTAAHAQLLKDAGVLVISVGIGQHIQPLLMNTLASFPEDVFPVDDFRALNTIEKKLANRTCRRVTPYAPECNTQADILFVLDSSGSVDVPSHHKMLDFASDVAEFFHLGPGSVQFSAIALGDTPQIMFDFDTYSTFPDIEKALLRIPYMVGSAQTDTALQVAREQAFTLVHGARPGVPKVVILFTDGHTPLTGDTLVQAQLLHSAGIQVIPIGIGDRAQQTQLKAIASDPGDAFQIADFDALRSIQAQVSNKTCERGKNAHLLPQCDAVSDIAFLLDASRSVNIRNYATMLNFVINMTRHFNLGPSGVQFADIVFGNNAHLIFNLTAHTNHAGLEQGIMNSPYLSENTYTDLALKMAREKVFSQYYGARQGVPGIAIVFMDGKSSRPSDTVYEAQRLRQEGVLILSIGIGDQVDQSELAAIASGPEYVFRVNNFDVLNTIRKEVTDKACYHVKPVCNRESDIVFLLDSSGSVDANDYRTQLRFAANFTENFLIGPSDTQFGAAIFSTTAQKLFDLKDFSTHYPLIRAIMWAPHLQTATNTAAALELVQNQNMFGSAAGGRANSTKTLIVMTDGQSDDTVAAKAAAQALKDSGVQIITVGIGSVVNKAELLAIASAPEDVFEVASFSALHKIQDILTAHTCGTVGGNLNPPACPESADIIFAFDSASSIPASTYSTQTSFAANLTEEFAIGPTATRFGAVIYSDDVLEFIDLNAYDNHLDLYEALVTAPHLSGASDIAGALDWIVDKNMFGMTLGGRDNAPNIVILLIDNPSTSSSKAILAAQRLKSRGDLVMTIGIENYDLSEVNSLATGPKFDFKISDISALRHIIRQVVDAICPYVKEVVATNTV